LRQIAWIADNAQKGFSSDGNAALTPLAIHASAEFSRDYFDAGRDEVAGLLLDAAAASLGVGGLGAGVTAWHLHRWKYARPVAAKRPMFLCSREPAPLVIAGDGLGVFVGSGCGDGGPSLTGRMAITKVQCPVVLVVLAPLAPVELVELGDPPEPKTDGTLTLIPIANAPVQYRSVAGAGGAPPHAVVVGEHQTDPTVWPCVRRISRPS
jgi:hypothetical protein